MKKIVFSTLALGLFVSGFALTGGVNTAFAGSNCQVNCNDPVKGKRGKNWIVLRCVVGSPGSYETVDCKSKEAVHKLPTGKYGVCFIGSDGRVHYTIQKNVWKGREFFNQFHGGRWKVNWQS